MQRALKPRDCERFRELRRQELARHSAAMLVQQEIGRRAVAPVGTADTADDPGAFLADIPVRMIEQPKRRIGRPWPVALGDMQRHADQRIAIEVERPAIRDLTDGERAKFLAPQTRSERPLRGKSRSRPEMREQPRQFVGAQRPRQLFRARDDQLVDLAPLEAWAIGTIKHQRHLLGQPERAMVDQPSVERPTIEAADGRDTRIDCGPGIRPPGMRAGILQHPVAISSDDTLIGLAPFDPRLFERVEPVVEMFAIGPDCFGCLSSPAQLGMLH